MRTRRVWQGWRLEGEDEESLAGVRLEGEDEESLAGVEVRR